MKARECTARVAAVLLVCLLTSAAAFAQTDTGTIAGVTKDSSGLALPGVSVEAASPALIEKVRTVVTDGQGQYKIVALPPGVYSVTFSLAGFNSIKRSGVELTTNFTANVNADLQVGDLQETLTVSAATPVVDVQNVREQRTLTADVVAAVPTGRTDETIAVLIPGALVTPNATTSNQDVGGSTGDPQSQIAVHGSRGTDYNNLIDNIPANGPVGLPNGGLYMDAGAVEEFSVNVGAISAETATGGVSINNVPKSGSDRFTGTLFAAYTNDRLENGNLTPALVAAGFTSPNHLNKLWDVNPSFGGPIRQGKLWFFVSTRAWGYQNAVGNLFYSADPQALKYTPDRNHLAIDDSQIGSVSARFTWQVTPRNKINGYVQEQGRCICHAGVGGGVGGTVLAPEAAGARHSPVDNLEQVTWTSAVSNRLLFEAGVMFFPFQFQVNPVSDAPSATTSLSVTDSGTGMTFRAAPTYSNILTNTQNARAALSYVTGSHAFKVGFSLQTASRSNGTFMANGSNVDLTLLNGVPKSVTEFTTPYTTLQHMELLGLYAQDQWTVGHVTLNAGLRFDHLNEYAPATNLPAAQFVGPRNFPAIYDVPNWNDLNPRLGVAYDLFGTGKTAVKVSLSRYVVGETTAFALANSPINTSVNSVTRTWNDPTGTFNPYLDCNLANPVANGACGAVSNASFGQTVITTRYDDAVRTGFGVRPDNWEMSAGVQHELLPRVSMNVGYFRRWYGNFTATHNLATTPQDYNPYCVTAPANPQLPGGGGYQVCGLYDVTPSLFGKVNNLVTPAGAFGNQWEHYNGVDLTVNARLVAGLLLQGGLNVGRDETNNCFVVNSPQQLLYCDVKPPFQPQVKLLGSLPLQWWGFITSATFQSLAGPPITATETVTNAQIAPSLSRNLAAGANGTATVNLIAPGTLYGDRLNQLDFRLSKIVKAGRTKIQGNFDLYNALNASPVLLLNTTYGTNWEQPTQILPGRLFKFGAQVSF
jgi:hypothetical protein